MGDIVILASYEYYFMKVHENLVQHTSNYYLSKILEVERVK